MEHVKSPFRDLHQLFEKSITVCDIGEPLASVDQDYPAKLAREFMANRGFDVIGVRREGSIEGYILEEDLKSGSAGDYLWKLKDKDILHGSDLMFKALAVCRTCP